MNSTIFDPSVCKAYEQTIYSWISQGFPQQVEDIKKRALTNWETCQKEGSSLVKKSSYKDYEVQKPHFIDRYKLVLAGFLTQIQEIEQKLHTAYKQALGVDFFIKEFPFIPLQSLGNMKLHHREGAQMVEESYLKNDEAIRSLTITYCTWKKNLSQIESAIEDVYLNSLYGFLQTLEVIEKENKDPQGWIVWGQQAGSRLLPAHTFSAAKAKLSLYVCDVVLEIVEDEKDNEKI